MSKNANKIRKQKIKENIKFVPLVMNKDMFGKLVRNDYDVDKVFMYFDNYIDFIEAHFEFFEREKYKENQ